MHLPNLDAPKFIGRARELSTIEAAFAGALRRRGRIVVITGEPGAGKTRLAQAAIRHTEATTGIRFGWGQTVEDEWCPPYGPWADALTAVVHTLTPAERSHLAHVTAPVAATLARLVPRLSPPDDHDPVSTLPPDGLSSEEERRWYLDALSLAFTALVDSPDAAPMVLVLDDIQWADPGSLALLRHMTKLVDRLPVLVIITSREPDDASSEHPWPRVYASIRRDPAVIALPVKPFDVDDAAALIAELTGHPPHPSLTSSLHAATAGNAFFLAESISHLRDIGALAFDGQLLRQIPIRADHRPESQSLDIPESVRHVMRHRLAQLPSHDHRLLELAALFPSGVELDILATLSGAPEIELVDRVQSLVTARLLVSAPGSTERYTFAHTLGREAIATDLLPARRVRLHRQIAEALQSRSQAHGSDDAADIAYHFHRSASLPDADRGVPYALTAAAQAQASGGRDQAVSLLRAARDLSSAQPIAQRLPVLVKLAEAEANALLLSQAEETAHTIHDQLDRTIADHDVTPAQAAAMLVRIATALKYAGSHRAAWGPIVRSGLQLVGSHDQPLTWARLHLLEDPIVALPIPQADEMVALRTGNWTGFDAETVKIARTQGNEDDAARSFESYDARSLADTSALVRLARTWQTPPARMRGLTVAANDLMYRHGDFHAATEIWRELLAACERHGAIGWQAQALQQLSLLAIAAGDFPQARQLTSSAADLLRQLGPYREQDIYTLEMRTCLALYLGGEWPHLAHEWSRLITSPSETPGELGLAQMLADTGPDLSLLAGAVFGGLAATAAARAGDERLTLATARAVVAVLQASDPTATNQNQNGAVAFAADAIWTITMADWRAQWNVSGAIPPLVVDDRQRAIASDLADLATTLIDAGIGDYPQTSLALTRARMASLYDIAANANDELAIAQRLLSQSGQAPGAAIARYDHGLLSLMGGHDPTTPDDGRLQAANTGFVDALTAFSELKMPVWEADARQLVELTHQLGRHGGQGIHPGLGYTTLLTEREIDVLRLIARGRTDRDIADTLFISPRTVHTHVRNLLSKTNLTNRTELSVWAVDQGLTKP